jgi:catechol 2,3-dioxygenase-like lactoylglutathione lyase family enzyme
MNQVTLHVGDVARSVAFYRQLGLVPVVDEFHYARFRCPDGDATVSVERTDGPVVPGGITVYFEYDDADSLDREFARLSAAGVPVEHGPVDQTWLWREARVRDPDGHVICLFHAGANRLDPPWAVQAPAT